MSTDSLRAGREEPRFLCGVLALALIATATLVAKAESWPAFRGNGSSVSSARELPLNWSSETNLAWRATLAGEGQSSPVIARGTVIVTSCEGPRKETLVVQAFDLASGRESWKHTAPSTSPEAVSDMRSRAAPTPITDDTGVYALFESGDCLALTPEGELRWARSLADSDSMRLAANHGLGGSPVRAGDLLVLPLDQERMSCLLALDGRTGKTAWKTERPGRTSWSTPLLARFGASTRLIHSGGGAVCAYDPATGRLLWEFDGLVKNLVPSPTQSGDTLFVAAGSRGSNLALKWDGESSAPVEIWRAAGVTSGFPSPLAYEGRVYFLSAAGVVSCLDSATGATRFEERVAQPSWASPIGACGRVYVFGERGVTTVLAATDTYQPLATNVVEVESRIVGAAVVEGSILMRSYTELICVRRRP